VSALAREAGMKDVTARSYVNQMRNLNAGAAEILVWPLGCEASWLLSKLAAHQIHASRNQVDVERAEPVDLTRKIPVLASTARDPLDKEADLIDVFL
jgi:hypothetical protein